ncbi:MAG: hypothetical protein K9M11_02220 [Candidatus Pacebacteria bacterium]|nr:hypothetical protein [Candidatus Paceibacterota bacterium]
MNKNITISVVVAVLVLVLGYMAFKNNGSGVPQTDQNASSTVPANTNLNTTDNQSSSTANTPTPARAVSAPSVQTNTEAVISNSTALVSGKVTPNGAQTSYWFDYGPTTSIFNHTSKQDVGAGYTPIAAPLNITGLKTNTQYYFRLNAQNSEGITRGEVRSFTTNDTPAVPGKAPSVQTTSSTNVERSSANLNGKINSNGSQTTWWFEYGERTSLGNVTTFGYIAGNQVSTSVTGAISGLNPLTKYYYRINAQNQFGTVNGTLSSFTTSGPANSNSPIIKTNNPTNISTSSVTMNGRLDPNGGDTTYWFEYSDDSLLGGIIGTVTPNQFMKGDEAAIGIKADVTDLRRNTKYYYRMVSRNEYGTVVGSVVSFKTK